MFCYQDEFRHVRQIQEAFFKHDDNIAAGAFLVAYWVNTCISDHIECQRNSTKLVSPHWPQRLVDLIDFEGTLSTSNSIVRIIETDGLREDYCALSYRWKSASSEAVKLTSENWPELASGLAPGRLPETIQDGFTIAKALGIRYMWVDALVRFEKGLLWFFAS